MSAATKSLRESSEAVKAAQELLKTYTTRKREELVRAAIIAQLEALTKIEGHAEGMFKVLGKSLGRTAFIYDAEVIEFEKIIEKTFDFNTQLGFGASALIKSHKQSFFRMMLGAALDLNNTKAELEAVRSSAERDRQNVTFVTQLIHRLIVGEAKMVVCDICRGDDDFYCEHCRGIGYREVSDESETR